jgi:Kef-type K+ transport system membrane component KefB
MEEIWEKDPELTFHQVKQYAESKFVGHSSFKSIEEERKRMLQKEYNRSQRKMIAEFLKFPKIIGSILLGILAYQGSFYFEKPSKYLQVLFALLLVSAIPGLYHFISNYKIQGKRFLAVSHYSLSLTSILSFPQIGINLSNGFKDEIQQNHLLIIPLICFWVIGLLFCATGIYLDIKHVAKVRKQYLIQ